MAGRRRFWHFAAGEKSDQPGPEMHLGLVLDVSESMGEELAVHANGGNQVPQHARSMPST